MKEILAVVSFAKFLIDQFPDLEEDFQKALVAWSKSPEGKQTTLNVIDAEKHEEVDDKIDALIKQLWSKP